MKKLMTLLVYLVLLILLFIFIKNNYNDFTSIPKISFRYLPLMIFLSFLGLYINGIRIKLFSSYYNINLKIKEWMGLAAITVMGNYLTPRGGVIARGFYLKKIHNFPYATFLTTMTALYIIRFLVYGLSGLLLTVLALIYLNIFNIWIFIAFLLLTLATLFLIFFPPEFRRRNNKILDWIINIINGWKLLSKDSRLLYKLSVYELFFVLIMGTRLFFAYRSFDLSVPIFIIFIISIFSTISTLISITPAGLGVTEFIITLSSTFLGLTVAEGLQVALLDRLASVIISFSFGLIYSYILMNNSNSQPRNFQ